MSDKCGPYVSVDFDSIYLPVVAYSFNQARATAASWAADFIPVWGRSRYTGRRDVPLHDHEDWEGCDECPSERSWCFDVYEGSPRW